MVQELIEEITELISESVGKMHTAMPGVIKSFNPDNGLAIVTPIGKYKVDEETELDYPDIASVPVVIPQSNDQSVSFAFPVKDGDGCLLVFSEKSNDLWLYEAETGTDLSFDLSNAIAIVGLVNKPNPLVAEATRSGKAIISSGSTKMTIGGGAVNVVGDLIVSGSIRSGSTVTASTSLDVGSTSISSGSISGNINVSGNVSAGGSVSGTNLSASGSVSGATVTAGSVSLGSHVHGYSWTDGAGSGTTGSPQ